MTTYNKFNRLKIDTSLLGLEQDNNHNLYFCTPKGAKIIGWAGVDGIHFCFVRGFGEMVFAVSPMNTPGNFVHPLASSFSDFLCLLLACGNTGALEQAYGWNHKQFDAFLAEDSVTEEQLIVLNIIRNKLNLQPTDHPFTYIKELQAQFDYSTIKFTEDYDHFIPPVPKLSEWKVYFNGNFWGPSEGQRAGKEIPTNIQFDMNNSKWHIPSVYSCSKGLVIDFCVQIPSENIRDFISKWNLSVENCNSYFTKEQQINIEAENPMVLNINPEIILNGKTISYTHGCGLSWNPCLPEHNNIETEGVLKRYNLDPASGWVIWRSAFPWSTTRTPSISSLSVTIKHNPVRIFGSHFALSIPGECVGFTHPITNIQHSMIIQEYEQQEMPMNQFGDTNYEYPTHYTVMSYILDPDLPSGSISIDDYNDGDQPRKKKVNPKDAQSTIGCVAIGVIGGADGPTSISFGSNNQGKLHIACSALHFNPVDTVEWQILFHEKPCPDMTVKIL